MPRYQIDYVISGNRRAVIIDRPSPLEEEDVPQALAERIHLEQRQDCASYADVLDNHEVVIERWAKLD